MSSEIRKATQVPGQLYGYSIQLNRALAHLLRSGPGDIASIEVLDDTALEQSDRLVAEQSKSARKKNPVSDKSTDLWKTLRNWADAVRDRKLPLNRSTFRIYVSAPISDSLITEMSNANTDEEAKLVLSKLRKLATDESWDAKAAKEHATQFVAHDPAHLIEIIKRFSLESGSGKQTYDLEALMKSKLIPDDVVSHAVTHALGWILQQFQARLEADEPATFLFDDFHHEVTSYVRSLRSNSVLGSLASEPSEDDVTQVLMRCFVKQLDLIDCDDDDKLEAVNDYLRAASDRTEWAKRGWVNTKVLDSFSDELRKTWKNFSKGVELNHKQETAVWRGKAVYQQCSGYKTRINGADVPVHFVPGCFHSLSDRKTIGWHPDFKTLL